MLRLIFLDEKLSVWCSAKLFWTKNSPCDAPPNFFGTKTLRVMPHQTFLEQKLSVWCSTKLFWSKNSPCDAPPNFFGAKTLHVMLRQTFLEQKLSVWCPTKLFWSKNSPCDAPPDLLLRFESNIIEKECPHIGSLIYHLRGWLTGSMSSLCFNANKRRINSCSHFL